MPGPGNIETVFVDIIARLENVEDVNFKTQVEEQVTGSVAALTRLQDKAMEALDPLRRLADTHLDIDTSALRRNLSSVEAQVADLVDHAVSLGEVTVPESSSFLTAAQAANQLNSHVIDLEHSLTALGDAAPPHISDQFDEMAAVLGVVSEDLARVEDEMVKVSGTLNLSEAETSLKVVDQSLVEVAQLFAHLKEVAPESGVPGLGAIEDQLLTVVDDAKNARRELETLSAGTTRTLNVDEAKAGLEELNVRVHGLGDAIHALPVVDVDTHKAVSGLTTLLFDAGSVEVALDRIGQSGGAATESLKAAAADAAAGLSTLLSRLGEAGVDLEKLDSAKFGPDTGSFEFNLQTLHESLTQILNTFKQIDQQGLEVEVGPLETELRGVTSFADQLLGDLNKLSSERVDLDVAPAEAALRGLDEQANAVAARIRSVSSGIGGTGLPPPGGGGGGGGGGAAGGAAGGGGEGPDLFAVAGTAATKEFNDQVDLLNTNIERGRGEINKFEQAFGNAFRRLLAFGFFTQVGQGLFSIFQQAIQATGQIENTTVALNRFFGLAQKNLGETSQQFLADLRTVALTTPFEFTGLADTSRRILAMGENAKDTIGTLSHLSDAVAAVGGTQDDIDGVVKALSQLSSKGRVDLQDFRQISERLPSLSRQLQIQGVIDELNKLHPGLNATFGDFENLRKSGLITGQVLRDGIIGAIQQIPGVEGAARAASENLQGALSNLKDFVNIEFAKSFQGLGRQLAAQLSEAFASVTDVGTQLTPLASAVDEFIAALGRAGEGVLPKLFDLVTKLAPSVAVLVQELGQLVQEVLPTLANVGQGAIGSLTGLVGVAKEFAAVIGDLPASVQQFAGSFITLSTVIPGAGEKLFAGFRAAVKLPGAIGAASAAAEQAATKSALAQVELSNALFLQGHAAESVEAKTLAAAAAQTFQATTADADKLAVEALKVQQEEAALAAQAFAAAVTLGLIVVLQGLLSTFQKSAEQQEHWNKEVDSATQSMENFTSTGDAAAAFVEQFGKAGATIDLGPLIAFGNALTSPQLADALHTNNQGLGELVRNIAALGNRRNDPAAFTKAVESAGVSMDALGNSSADAQLNLEALTEQFQQGAKSAFDQEVADKKNVLVSDQVVAAIRAKAAATNDYVDAQDELTAAQQAAAQAAFALLSAQLNPDEAQKIIDDNTTYTVGINNTRIATVDWTKANLDAQQALAKVDNAFVDLGTRFPGFNQAFNALSQGIADGADSLVDFAVRSDKAKLSADDLNAVANKLGPALGQALSGDELSKVLVAAKARVDEFSTALAGLVPSITGLQVTADGFTLDHFLGQLELIAIARTSVIKNLNAIADQFGQLGADAIEALTKSGLQGDTFAIAVQQALAGGPKALQRVVDDFQAATGLALGQFGDTTVQDLQGLSQKLTAQGLTPETIDKILGTDAFKNAADDQKGALDKLNVDLFNFALQRNQIVAAAGQGPLTGAALAALQLTNAAIDQAQAAIGAGGQPNVVVPTVDTQKAQTDAAAAGHLAAQSFTQQMSTDIFGGFVDVDNQVYSGIDALGPAGSLHAQAAALQVASGLIFGTVAGLGPFADAVSTAVGTSTLKAVPVALAVGGAVAAAFGQGVVQIVADVAATGEAAELEIRKFDFVGTALMSIAAADFVHSFEGNFDELPVVVAVDLDLVLGAIGSAAPSFELAAAGLALLTASAFAGNLQLVGVVNSALNDALTAMTGFLPLFQGEGFQIGTALGQGVKDGLNSTVEQIAAAAADAVAKAEEAAKQQAGAHSPSRVFARLGMDLSRGLAQGIAQGAPQVEQAAAASVQAAQAGVVHNHQWNIDVPTDDPAMFARRAADRLERRLV